MATRLGDSFTDIMKHLDAIEDRLDFVVDGNELGDAVLDSVALCHRVEAITARIGLAATMNGVPNQHGQRTIGQFVASRTNSPSSHVSALTANAKWLRDYRTFEAAFGNELSTAHVNYLRKNLAANFETRTKLMAEQEFFVETAASCTFKGFKKACDYWLVMVDPDGKEPQDQIDKSGLRIGNGRGGRGEIRGTCDAVTAQAISTAVEHEADKIRTADIAAGIERTDSQRRMAALAALVTRGFARPDGSFPAPLGNIVMSLKVAEWALAQLNSTNDPEDADHVPVAPNDIDGRCELIDGTPIHPFLALIALGLAGPGGTISVTKLRRYILDANSRALDVSVDARSFPEWMRTTAMVQSRGQCGVHGCDVPHHWLQIDHVDPVANGGPTRLDNAEPQCRPDNQAKGATTGQTAWRDRPHPDLRPPRRTNRSNTSSDDDPDADHPSDHN